MKVLTCIVCPIGCSLQVTPEPRGVEGLAITGNGCQRGVAYAQEEVRSPKRVVTATCAIDWSPVEGEDALKTGSLGDPRRVPVKTGDRAIADWRGTRVRVVAVRSMG
ncbi:MAG: DUF1667 domain-containing protein [Treponema sp.]|jgi:CxxC motif-containing protein|nr:DUF1667 domain-containing protein [Treponema sp.]